MLFVPILYYIKLRFFYKFHFISRIIITYMKREEDILQTSNKIPYSTHNAYTNPKSVEQIGVIIVALLQIVVNAVYVPYNIFQLKNRFLQFLLIFNFGILVIVIGHYIYLTVSDPVDSLILDQQKSKQVQKLSPKETIFCIFCFKLVKRTSHHCMNCGRCTQDFDHHCKYLNNCICLQNYKSFIRLLLFYLFFCIGCFLQSFWLYKLLEDPSWAHIFLLILNGVIILAIGSLLIFHIYLNCYLGITTYQFIIKWREQHQKQPNQHYHKKSYLQNEVDSGQAIQKKQRIQSYAETNQ